MMHLKQIEREALALRAATARDSSGTLSSWPWIIGAVKRFLVPLRPEVRVGDGLNLGKH
jgi:hypothetical protein